MRGGHDRQAHGGAQAYSRLSVRIVGGLRFLGQHTSGGGAAAETLRSISFDDRSGRGEFKRLCSI